MRMRRLPLALVLGGALLATLAAPALAEVLIVTPGVDGKLVGPAEPANDTGLANFDQNVFQGVPNSETAFDREANPVDMPGRGG